MVCVPVRRDNPRTLATGLSTVQAHMISSIELAHYGVSRAKDCVYVDCGAMLHTKLLHF